MDIEDPNTPTPLPPLNEELVLTLWSRTYNTSGKPDWSHIFPYYTEDIIFQRLKRHMAGDGGKAVIIQQGFDFFGTVAVEAGKLHAFIALVAQGFQYTGQIFCGFLAGGVELIGNSYVLHDISSIKKDVKDLRNNQVRATFSAPNTKIARVRESLIGSFRNQLESLAIAKNARLTFEYEISHFQTGGRQISVVYDSVKKAEVLRPGNDVDIKQAWGGIKRGLSTKPMLVREFPQYAFEVVAGGTSSFCTNCKRDAYDWLKENDIKGLMGTEVRPDLGQAKWRDFAKEKISEYAEDHANFDVNKALEMVEIHENADVKIREKTSTVDLFICPFCGHITHADKQAAFNIAVRGALKDRELEKYPDRKMPDKLAGDQKLSRDNMTKWQANLEFAPVEL